MPKLDPAIRHAITPIAFDKGKLHRERLVDALHSQVERKLIVIAAPAGYGKTTLLADFTSVTEIPICWARLTDLDKDYIHLAEVVYESLCRRFRRLSSSGGLVRPRTSSPEELGSSIAYAIGKNIPEAFVVIIDDADNLENDAQALAFLDSLVLASPEQVTYVLSGRHVIELSLARLMAEGNLAGFGPGDLALTREELLGLSEIAGGILNDEFEADRLLSDTQGWIAGILLSSSFAKHRLRIPTLDDQNLVYDYLASATLNRMPSRMRQFLLESSILPRLTASECDRLLAVTDSEQTLSEAVSSGLFVSSTDETPPSYEYHPLFRNFLRDTLKATNLSRFKGLSKEAAQSYKTKGDFEMAVDLFLQAGEIDEAVQIVVEAARSASNKGWLSTLQKWERELRDLGHELPVLQIEIARCLIDRGIFAEARSLLEAVEIENDTSKVMDRLQLLVFVLLSTGDRASADQRLCQLEETVEDLAHDSAKAKYIALCSRYKALLLLRHGGDLSEALEYATNAVDYFSAIEGEDSNLISSLHTKTTILENLSRFREALVVANRALEIQARLASPVELSTVLNNLGVLYHQTGEYHVALDHFHRALGEARRGASELSECYILISQADLFNDLGLVRQAGELYEKGLEMSLRLGRKDLIVYTCARIAMMHRRRTTTGVAISWVQRAIELGGGMAEVSPEVRIERLGLEVTSKLEEASQQLEEIVSQAENETPPPRSDEVLAAYFLTSGHFANGSKDSAHKHLRRLLHLISRGETHQTIAAELLANPEFDEFVRSQFERMPAVEMLSARVRLMQSTVNQFGGSIEEASGGMHGLRIDALGSLQIQMGKENRLDLLKPQVREILVFLADNGPTEREELAKQFWSGHPAGRQIANLHMAIYSLRASLQKDSISLEGVSYRISQPARLKYDVAEFEKAATIAERLPLGDPRRLFALTEALRLYTGPFLIGFESDWVIDRRRMLELRYLDLIGMHADETLIRNQPRLALDKLREALEIEPLRDDLNAKYIEALGQLGQRSEVARHYQKYKELLRIELGLTPSEAVEELYLELMG